MKNLIKIGILSIMILISTIYLSSCQSVSGKKLSQKEELTDKNKNISSDPSFVSTVILENKSLSSCNGLYTKAIAWEDRKLTIEDFKVVDKFEIEDQLASIVTSIKLEPSNRFKNGYVAVAYAIPEMSRIKRGIDAFKLEKILEHETGHFKITEYYARVINFLLKTYDYEEDEINILYNSILDKWDTCQKVYDAQTNHYNDQVSQDLWNKKLNELLSEYDHFDSEIYKRVVYLKN